MTLWNQITDRERDAFIARMAGGFAITDSPGVWYVPLNLRGGLLRYFSDGILPGSFLQAVLVNDLLQAVARGDPFSRAQLARIVEYLIEFAPAMAWGSREAVLRWTTTPDRLEV